jgi:hypothetical protein
MDVLDHVIDPMSFSFAVKLNMLQSQILPEKQKRKSPLATAPQGRVEGVRGKPEGEETRWL